MAQSVIQSVTAAEEAFKNATRASKHMTANTANRKLAEVQRFCLVAITGVARIQCIVDEQKLQPLNNCLL